MEAKQELSSEHIDIPDRYTFHCFSVENLRFTCTDMGALVSVPVRPVRAMRLKFDCMNDATDFMMNRKSLRNKFWERSLQRGIRTIKACPLRDSEKMRLRCKKSWVILLLKYEMHQQRMLYTSTVYPKAHNSSLGGLELGIAKQTKYYQNYCTHCTYKWYVCTSKRSFDTFTVICNLSLYRNNHAARVATF